MIKHYEKPEWNDAALDLKLGAGLFKLLGMLIGAIGVLLGLILGLIALKEASLSGVFSALMLIANSVLLMIFAKMMRVLSVVVLALYEMVTVENRIQIKAESAREADTDGSPTSPADGPSS